MLTEEDFAKFTAFRVRAMGQRLREMCEDESYDSWTFEEKVKEMIDAEDAARQERKVAKLVREARFKEPAACVEDVIYMPERKLSKDRLARLAECGWVEGDEVLVAISKTGCGKSFVAQALGNARAGGCTRRATCGSRTSAASSTGPAWPPTGATTGPWTASSR